MAVAGRRLQRRQRRVVDAAGDVAVTGRVALAHGRLPLDDSKRTTRDGCCLTVVTTVAAAVDVAVGYLA